MYLGHVATLHHNRPERIAPLGSQRVHFQGWFLVVFTGFRCFCVFAERFQKGFAGLIPVVLLIMKTRCIVSIF